MKAFYCIVCFLVLACGALLAQDVEHNYKVGPKFAGCDSLNLKNESFETTVELIKQTSFRFTQSFKLRRPQGLQRADYFSCDTITGFLMVMYDGEEYLYLDVSKQHWENFISFSDPEAYYLRIKSGLKQVYSAK